MAYSINKTALILARELEISYPTLVNWLCDSLEIPFKVNSSYTMPYWKVHQLDKGYIIEYPGFTYGNTITLHSGVIEIPYELYYLVNHLFR